MKYIVKPIRRNEAQEFVRRHHRHNKPPVGDLFRTALFCDDDLIGVAIVGRPVSRHLDNGLNCEVIRLCVLDGHRNACSTLYARACRVAKALGYQNIYTYTLITESGSSLRASGFTKDAESPGGQWSCATRPRQLLLPEFQNLRKIRWLRVLNK